MFLKVISKFLPIHSVGTAHTRRKKEKEKEKEEDKEEERENKDPFM